MYDHFNWQAFWICQHSFSTFNAIWTECEDERRANPLSGWKLCAWQAMKRIEGIDSACVSGETRFWNAWTQDKTPLKAGFNDIWICCHLRLKTLSVTMLWGQTVLAHQNAPQIQVSHCQYTSEWSLLKVICSTVAPQNRPLMFKTIILFKDALLWWSHSFWGQHGLKLNIMKGQSSIAVQVILPWNQMKCLRNKKSWPFRTFFFFTVTLFLLHDFPLLFWNIIHALWSCLSTGQN